MLAFVSPHDEILTQTANRIPLSQIKSNTTQHLIDTMLNISYGEQKNKARPVLVGLAAPQVGISKRIILVDTAADGHGKVAHLDVFINPEIIEFSESKEEWYEGCYSTDRVCGIVARSKNITLRAYDRTGNSIQRKYKGYVARIFQHEIDHLDGIVFIDHIKDDAKLHWVEKDEFPAYRDKEAWRNWPKKCTKKHWESIKNGA